MWIRASGAKFLAVSLEELEDGKRFEARIGESGLPFLRDGTLALFALLFARTSFLLRLRNRLMNLAFAGPRLDTRVSPLSRFLQ